MENNKKILQFIEDFKNKWSEKGYEVFLTPEDFLDDDHLHCLYYGGEIGGISNDNYKIVIRVSGDIYASYYKDNDILLRIKDKSNAGSGYEFMRYFKNDEELTNSFIPMYGEEPMPEFLNHVIVVDNRNWIEVEIYDKKTDEYLYSEDCVLDDEDVLEAFNSLDNIVEEIEKEEA